MNSKKDYRLIKKMVDYQELKTVSLMKYTKNLTLSRLFKLTDFDFGITLLI